MPKKILVVDDMEVFRVVLKDVLEERGFEVSTARDGIEAFEAINANRFDLVLLDLLLPRMSGFELLKQLRASSRTMDLPVLAMSGVYSKDDHLSSLKDLRATGFISKLLSPSEIADRAEREFSEAEKPAPDAASPAAEKKKPKDEAAEKLKMALADLRLFRNLDDEDLDKIVKIARWVKFYDGQAVIKEGEEGDKFFGIIGGTISVEKLSPSGDEVNIAKLGAGDEFGELALVDREKRSATCRAEGEVEAVEITRDAFEKAMRENPELERKCLRSLLMIVAERLRETDTRLTFSRSLLEWVTD